MSEDVTTRDFIYLDVERVRSLYAQMEEGLLESTTRDLGAERTAQLAVQGGVPFFAKGEGSASVLWKHGDSETRTLHDHMFNVVDERLRNSPDYIDFNSRYNDKTWDREAFGRSASPSAFIKISGSVRLNDFDGMLALIRRFHELAEIMAALTLREKLSGLPKQAAKQLMKQTVTAEGLPEEGTLKGLADLMELLLRRRTDPQDLAAPKRV